MTTADKVMEICSDPDNLDSMPNLDVKFMANMVDIVKADGEFTGHQADWIDRIYKSVTGEE